AQWRSREKLLNAIDDGNVRHAAPALQKTNVQIFSFNLRIGGDPAMAIQLAVGVEHADFVLNRAERGVVGSLRQIETHDIAARTALQEHRCARRHRTQLHHYAHSGTTSGWLSAAVMISVRNICSSLATKRHSYSRA